MKLFGILFLILFSILLSGCTSKKWYGVYENSNISVPQITAAFEDRETCADWLEDAPAAVNAIKPGSYNFECGSDCKLSESGIIYYCDETFD